MSGEKEKASGISVEETTDRLFARESSGRPRNQTAGSELRAKQQEQSTANDESYDSPAATNEYCIFEYCGKATK